MILEMVLPEEHVHNFTCVKPMGHVNQVHFTNYLSIATFSVRFKCKIIHCLANIPIEFSVATTMATTSKTITENTIETSITEATTTPPSHNTTATPATANETESTATASSEISTRTTGNAKANLSTSSAARGIQGRSGVGLIIAILLAPMVLFEK